MASRYPPLPHTGARLRSESGRRSAVAAAESLEGAGEVDFDRAAVGLLDGDFVPATGEVGRHGRGRASAGRRPRHVSRALPATSEIRPQAPTACPPRAPAARAARTAPPAGTATGTPASRPAARSRRHAARATQVGA